MTEPSMLCAAPLLVPGKRWSDKASSTFSSIACSSSAFVVKWTNCL